MWGGRDVRFFRPEAARLRNRRGAGTCGTEWGVGGRGTAGRNGRSANSGGPRVRARGASRQTGPTRVWRTPLRTHVRGAHVRTHSHERRRLVRTHRGRAATANPPGGGGAVVAVRSGEGGDADGLSGIDEIFPVARTPEKCVCVASPPPPHRRRVPYARRHKGRTRTHARGQTDGTVGLDFANYIVLLTLVAYFIRL